MNEKIEIFVSDKCSDSKEIMEDYKKNPQDFEGVDFVNISDSMDNLRRFLAYRDKLDGFDKARDLGDVGIPSKVIGGKEVDYLYDIDQDRGMCEIDFSKL
ncbi:MAG: hypothetical protein Q4D88_00590 [Anaerococcus sp.]|nr:hypothetical protein [Anaerococcus sp.]